MFLLDFHVFIIIMARPYRFNLANTIAPYATFVEHLFILCGVLFFGNALSYTQTEFLTIFLFLVVIAT